MVNRSRCHTGRAGMLNRHMCRCRISDRSFAKLDTGVYRASSCRNWRRVAVSMEAHVNRRRRMDEPCSAVMMLRHPMWLPSVCSTCARLISRFSRYGRSTSSPPRMVCVTNEASWLKADTNSPAAVPSSWPFTYSRYWRGEKAINMRIITSERPSATWSSVSSMKMEASGTGVASTASGPCSSRCWLIVFAHLRSATIQSTHLPLQQWQLHSDTALVHMDSSVSSVLNTSDSSENRLQKSALKERSQMSSIIMMRSMRMTTSDTESSKAGGKAGMCVRFMVSVVLRRRPGVDMLSVVVFLDKCGVVGMSTNTGWLARILMLPPTSGSSGAGAGTSSFSKDSRVWRKSLRLMSLGALEGVASPLSIGSIRSNDTPRCSSFVSPDGDAPPLLVVARRLEGDPLWSVKRAMVFHTSGSSVACFSHLENAGEFMNSVHWALKGRNSSYATQRYDALKAGWLDGSRTHGMRLASVTAQLSFFLAWSRNNLSKWCPSCLHCARRFMSLADRRSSASASP
mmetsp:Transcript_35862/g.89992  ORF Transcript_35862/g.89992 Transcript_35862/m.89992 type:complete len:513 (-) Transcript_35862:291-1829(-)